MSDTRPPVLVAGDCMLDVAVHAARFRRTPEDPQAAALPAAGPDAPAAPGGAANVAANLAALGCRVVLYAHAGADPEGRRLVRLAEAAGVRWALPPAPDAPTTVKTRYYESGRLCARVDRDGAVPPAHPPRDWAGPPPAAVVLTDYGRGAVTPIAVTAWLAWADARGVPTYLDPKVGREFVWAAARPPVDHLVANWTEAAAFVTDEYGPGTFADPGDDAAAATLAGYLRRHAGVAAVVKRGRHGSTWADGAVTGNTPPVHPQEVFDVQGAGDTYLAGLVAGRVRGLGLADGCLLASAAAGVAVGRPGTAVVAAAEAAAAVAPHVAAPAGVVSGPAAADLARRLRGFGLRVGMTGGCFDGHVLHPGHLAVLRAAAAACDFLIAGVDADARVRMLKGEGRPATPAADRAAAVAAVRGVGAVVVFDTHPADLLAAVRPDVYVKGGDYTAARLPEAARLGEWGGRLVLVPPVATPSTTARLAGG